MTSTPVDEKQNLWLFSPEQKISTMPVRCWDIAYTERVESPFCIVDFEAYFSRKYSLTTHSVWDYIQNPAFHPYLVGVLSVPGNGLARVMVGPPGQIPWDQINGLRWLSHNAALDELIFRKCLSRGIISTTARPRMWDCTMDMLGYLQRRKGLEVACMDLLGVKVDKSAVERMRGGGDNISEQDIVQYVYGDVYWPAVLWSRFSHEWPEKERALSRQTRYIGWQGVYVDREQLVSDIAFLDRTMQGIAKSVPWVGGKRSITSIQELQKQCAREGIPCPHSVDLDDMVTIQWDRTYGATRPWLHSIKRYTRARQTKTFFEKLLAWRRRDGTVPFSLKYCKAPHTHRWQSGEGLRMQNLDKEPCEGIKIRHRLRPRPGESFIIVDSTQIEPRVLNWLAGNMKFLEMCAKGMSPYEAHARTCMGYANPQPLKKVDMGEYDLAKAQTLMLGYQGGPAKFVQMAREYCKLFLHEFEQTARLQISGKDVWFTQKDLEKARQGHGDSNLMRGMADGRIKVYPPATEVVRQFRAGAKETRSYWYRCENEMRADIGHHHFVHLPCGIIRYFDVTDTSDGMRASIVYKSTVPDDIRHFYGGKLTENRVQFVSRCVFAEKLLLLDHIPVGRLNWHSHDEAIIRVPTRHAEEMLAWSIDRFARSVEWAPDLPLAAEGMITDKYDK